MCEYNLTIIRKVLAEGIWYKHRSVSHRSFVEGGEPIVKLFHGCEWPGFRHVLDADSSIIERASCDVTCAFDVSA